MKNILAAIAVVLVCACMQAGAADLDTKYTFSIPSQSLASALLTFSEQAKIQVMTASADLAGVESPGVSGLHTARDALDALLQGTGLKFRSVASDAVAIEPAAARRASASTATPEDRLELQEIVVTGTRIRGADVDGASPVRTIARQEISTSGATTVMQVLENLPANFGGGISEDTAISGQDIGNTSSNAGRASGINLRGLGTGSTLVLIDGHRMPAASSGVSPDISMIPLALVERVEVLKDGASPVYGSDAIGGVVNFILRDDFEGQESYAQVGAVTEGDRVDYGIGHLAGINWDGGNAVASVDYNRREALDAADRKITETAPEPFTLLPQSETVSAYVSARQALSSAVRLSGNAMYSKRKSTDEQSIDVGFIISGRQDSDNDQLMASLGVELDVTPRWTASLLGTYADTKTDATVVFSGFPLPPGASHFSGNASSIEALAQGQLFSLPGGMVKAAFGAAYREEEYSQADAYRRSRDNAAVFAELLIPALDQVDVSLAGRYEDYSDFGETFNSRTGIVWSPVEGLIVRGSYSTSFRAPSLFELQEGDEIDRLWFQPDPLQQPAGESLVITKFGGNPQLAEETADSFTAGVIVTPSAAPGLRVEAGYFRVTYDDRIGVPGNFDNLLLRPDVYAEFIDRSPTVAEVQELASRPAFSNFVGDFEPEDVVAIIDQRRHNIAAVEIAGLDLFAQYLSESRSHTWNWTLDASYFSTYEEKLSRLSGTIDRVGTVYYVPEWRARGGLTWSDDAWSATAFLNYVDGSRDGRLPTSRPSVASWTTVDLQLARKFERVQLALSVQNLFDREPPFAESFSETGINYDAENTSALGRFVSLRLVADW